MSGLDSAIEGKVVDRILLLESKRCDAIVAKDIATLNALLDDALIYTHSSAHIESKASFIESIRSGRLRYEKIDREDTRVRVFGNVVAVVTGRARFTMNQNEQHLVSNARFTSVWADSDFGANEWRFVAWQATKVATIV